jgi:hypothetical protein
MGISTALQAAHNDDLHTGNAKRAAASGLASLDASSKVVQEPASKGLASGVASLDASSKVVQEPASKAVASGLASLDASSKVVQEPASKAVASGLASLDASSKVVQEPASKGLASGLAALDAGSMIAVSNLPVNTASGIAGLDASSRVQAAQLALAELIANKNAASGYAGLDASILLALTQQRLNFNIGTFSRDTGAADGTINTTGIGFQPRLIILFVAVTNAAGQMSIGVSDGTKNYCLADTYGMTANTYLISPTTCIYIWQTGSINCSATAGMIADGFSLSWTKTGAKTGTATIFYIAIR